MKAVGGHFAPPMTAIDVAVADSVACASLEEALAAFGYLGRFGRQILG